MPCTILPPLVCTQPRARQRLDRWLLVNTEYQGVLRWVQVQPHHVSRFRRKLGVGADAPRTVTRQLDALLAQHTPHSIIRRPQRSGKTAAIPTRHAIRRRKPPLRKDSIAKPGALFGGLAGPGLISQASQAARCEPSAPLPDRIRAQAHLARKSSLRLPATQTRQHDACALRQAHLAASTP
jgi:hypothetical protein